MTPWYNPDLATTLQNASLDAVKYTSKRGLRLPVGYCGIRALETATKIVPIEVEQEGEENVRRIEKDWLGLRVELQINEFTFLEATGPERLS